MSQPADPISSPEAYRASLLAALGEDDPAVAQAETPARDPCPHRSKPASACAFAPSPANGPRWSASATSSIRELVVSARVRWILAEDEPDIVGYDQALWVAELRHNEDDPALLLATFEALRRGQPRPVGAAPGRGPRARRAPPGARTGELRHDVPARCRARPDPSRPGPPGARRGRRPVIGPAAASAGPRPSSGPRGPTGGRSRDCAATSSTPAVGERIGSRTARRRCAWSAYRPSRGTSRSRAAHGRRPSACPKTCGRARRRGRVGPRPRAAGARSRPRTLSVEHRRCRAEPSMAGA